MTGLLARFAETLQEYGGRPAGDAARSRAAVLVEDFRVCRDAGRRGRPVARAPWPPSVAELAAADAQDADAGDRDDVHWASLTHPGSVVWPVVLRVGTHLGSAGTDQLRAASVGYHAVALTAGALGSAHARSFHTTATAGAVGAAAAAAVLLQLGPDQWVETLGHAFSVLGGSRGALLERSDTRAFHRAHAVRTGIAAALAAADGLTATAGDLERAQGGLTGLDGEALFADRPDTLTTTSVRVFPTSGWNQAAYEAALTAGSRIQGELRRIVVEVPTAVSAISTGLTARSAFDSLEQSVVAALRRSHDQSPAALARSMTVGSREVGAGVRLETADEEVEAAVAAPLDHPTRPAAISALVEEKWRRPAGEVESCLRRLAVRFASPTAEEIA